MKNLSLIILGIVLFSCSKEPEPWPQKTMDPELYARDSTYIALTHKQRLKSNPSNNNSGIITKDLYVDVILYSPDTLKVFSASIERKILSSEAFEELDEDVPRYTGRGLAGYREHTSDPWKLFYLPLISTTTNSYEETRLSLRAYFLDQIKDHHLGIIDDEGNSKTVPMRYSVADPEFWNGPLFTRGNRIQGRYLFETRGSGTMVGHPYQEISPFKAEYPDLLIEQF